MSRDMLRGQWPELRGRLRQRWGRFTDDDLECIGGDRDLLMGTIQRRYGHSRQQAQFDLDDWLSIEAVG